MTLGHAEHFVDAVDPGSLESDSHYEGVKSLAQVGLKAHCGGEEGFRSLGIGLRQREKLATALCGYNIRGFQEGDQRRPS